MENIDIGGPTMVRAAAKNFAWVGVLCDPSDYPAIMEEMKKTGELSLETRKNLAEKAFQVTSDYDHLIHQYFMDCRKEEAEADNTPKSKNSLNDNNFPTYFSLTLKKLQNLRYGENPHQRASAYQFSNEKTGIISAQQFQGKALSYNNILDADAANAILSEFEKPACVIVKHTNPCGVAEGDTIEDAYKNAYLCDPLSAYGGIVAMNRPCTKDIAEGIASIFLEIILAPYYTDEALAIFANKPNLRLLSTVQAKKRVEWHFVSGGALLQETDLLNPQIEDLKIVTHLQPQQEDLETMLFAWRVLKHVKSNAILLAKEKTTVGIGGGQVSRIDAVEIALRKAGSEIQGTVLASDAFFPFRDSIDRIASTGIRAIIQPGGSIRDEEVIKACNEYGIPMVFTGMRSFRH